MSAAGLCLAATLAAISPAEAHEIIPGLRGFPSLLLHPFVGADTLLVLVGVSLAFATQRQGVAVGLALAAIVAGAIAGVVLQHGGLLAAGIELTRGLGLILAFATSATVALGTPRERLGVAGDLEVALATIVATGAVLVLGAGPLRALRRRAVAADIGCRVVGAWVAAIAALAFAAGMK